MTVGTNLSVRIVAILLAGFVALQLLIVAATTLPSRGDEQRPYNLPRPREAAAMVGAIEQAPAQSRAALVSSFNNGLYSVQLGGGVEPSLHPTTDDLVALARYYAAAMPGHAVAVDARRPLLGRLIGSRPRPARFFAPVSVSISLDGGSALVLTSQPSPTIRRYLRDRSALGAISGLLLLAILLLAVRQTTRPIVRLAKGVRRFGADLGAPDLPMTGPREVRELAYAFNEMKDRIRRLVADRTRMLAAIAHDMRTYLTRLRLRADYIEDPSHRERAERDLDEMSALLDDTLALAAEDSPDRANRPVIDLGETVRAAIAARETPPGRLSLTTSPGTMVRASPIAIRRIVDNLVDNSLRYATAVTIVVTTFGDEVHLVVTDDGPGVPSDLVDRIGEPFVRAEPSRNRDHGGAGLGLAIVKSLAIRDGARASFGNSDAGGFKVSIVYLASSAVP
ncbi:ATP-binding protein [Hephaestia mangrovi]|uniref:ATP-binding protein n=1 Tax=Hephaestia mangrovi TaxID=2873268 RepID=UPI001CA74A11|nr:ATP-binding protein [Hephaestia mangrovi]MBY8826524.1 HAMP domain-containing protein [Hephaestia mangrovi]